MSRASLLTRRVAARRGLAALVWLLVLGLAASLGVTVGHVRGAGIDSAREGLASSPPQARSVLLMTRRADDGAAAAEQDRRATRAIDARMGPTPYTLYRETRSEALPVAVDGEPGADRWIVSTPALLRSVGGSGDRAAPTASGAAIDRSIADTTEGAWPSAATGDLPGAAVQADAAEAAGIEVGDTLTLGAREGETGSGVRVAVTGLWRVTDGEASRWFGDPLVTTGTDGEARGPILVADDVLARIDTTPFARWLVVPDANRITPTDLERTVTLADDLDTTLADDDAVAIRGFQALGDYRETASDVSTRIRAAGAVSLVAVILLALAGTIALVQVTQLVAAVREGETTLLVSRGADAGTVMIAAAVENVVLAVTASGAGAVLAGSLLGGPDGRWPVLLTVSAVVASAAIVVGVVVTGVRVRAALRRRATDRSGRLRRATAAGTVILTIVAAGVCAWQFAARGSPLVVTPAGARVDPLSAAAPALLLAAGAVMVAAVLGPATRVWARIAAVARGAGPVLAARQVTRRLVVYVLPVVLLALAAGATTLAGAYAGTARTLADEVSVLRTGADVRVRLPAGQGGTQSEPTDAAATYSGLDGTSAIPVFTTDAVVAETGFTLVAAPSAELPRVMHARPEVADVEHLAGALATSNGQDTSLPVVMTDHLARTLNLGEGDRFELVHGGAADTARIVATTAVVPGVLERDVMLTDADALAQWRRADGADPVAANEIWLAATGGEQDAGRIAALASDARRIAAEHPGAGGRTATVTTARDAERASTPVHVAFWLAAAGTGALGLLGVVVAAVALLRDRRGEVIVLRGVGIGPWTQGAVRAVELVATGGAAVVLGALGGLLVARFTASGLARATLTGIDVPIPARFVLDVPATAGLLAVVAGGLVAVAVVIAAVVVAQARDTAYREEVR